MQGSAVSSKNNNGLTDLDIMIERERRRRARLRNERIAAVRDLPAADFARRTEIKVPTGANETIVPFELWPAQSNALAIMEIEHLLIFLKARQLGISWLVCLYVLRRCLFYPGQQVLFLSKDQKAANKLAERTSFLYHHHQDQALFPYMVKDGTRELEWSNGSNCLSLPATKDAGRNETASIVVLDEWGFMTWPKETLDAVKPTTDAAGGQLFIISSADGPGTLLHQTWEAAEAGANGYTPIFLPWFARPDRHAEWRNEKLAESGGDTASINREYPANALEAFANAAGLVYDVWSDAGDGSNVTEAADFVPGAGPVYWGVDDGYSGQLDKTGNYTATSHPRVFLLCQLRADGRLNVFEEHYAVGLQNDEHLGQILALPYPRPDYAAVDRSAAELKGRMHAADIYTENGPGSVEESIKALRRMLAPDVNGWRRVQVHPRCRHLRYEMARYRLDEKRVPIKAYDHGADASRYICWTFRHEE